MATTDCAPEQTPCAYRGFAGFDWAWSLFRGLCNVQGWLGAIQDNTSIASNGSVAVQPSYAQVVAGANVQEVTIPAGALNIHAYIDQEYASSYSITIINASGNVVMPEGTDLRLPFLSPVYTANADGQDAAQGHGVYPQTVLRYPAGSKGFVTATYRTAALPIIVTQV